LIETIASEWFTEPDIAEVITAHELYHLLARQPSSPAVERSAHAFARNLLKLPFCPTLYEKILVTAQ